jgi:hypothetical protein
LTATPVSVPGVDEAAHRMPLTYGTGRDRKSRLKSRQSAGMRNFSFGTAPLTGAPVASKSIK